MSACLQCGGSECICGFKRRLEERDDEIARLKAERDKLKGDIDALLESENTANKRAWLAEQRLELSANQNFAAKYRAEHERAERMAGVITSLRSRFTPNQSWVIRVEDRDRLHDRRTVHEVIDAAIARETTKADGMSIIAAERRRQVESEGWTPEHDDEHIAGELSTAAACYAQPAIKPHGWWPWDEEWWKPTPKMRVRELAKAGALIAAEIDRLIRIAGETPQGNDIYTMLSPEQIDEHLEKNPPPPECTVPPVLIDDFMQRITPPECPKSPDGKHWFALGVNPCRFCEQPIPDNAAQRQE